MANLIVTFTKAFPNVAGVEIGNVAIGSEARTGTDCPCRY